MLTADDVPEIGLITIPRAVLSVAAGVFDSVERAMVGDARVRTARGNAWDAMCADRARAQNRDEVRRLVAALAAARPMPALPAAAAGLSTAAGVEPAGSSAQSTVGSSPRSSASQAALVSTGLRD